jgi:GNAT superfamily N-acetyltransferase
VLRVADRLGSLGYAVQVYGPEARAAVLDLLAEVLGPPYEGDGAAEFWQWKHEANPFGPSAGLYARDAETGKALGLRILMRWVLEGRDGERIPAARAVDTATHPAYRRRGIFSELTRQAIGDLAREGVGLIFNTPNRETSLPGYLKLGWRVVAEWPLYVRLLRPGRMAGGLLGRWQDADGAPSFGEFFGPGILPWAAFEARYGAVLEGFLEGWEGSRVRTGLRTLRDASYLRWRYGGHPLPRYGVWPWEDGDGLAGVAIVRPNRRRGLREVVLAELLLREADPGPGRDLLRSLRGQLRGDYLVAHFGRGTLELDLLKRAGFFRIPGRGLLFVARSLQGQQPEALAAGNWDLSLGDLEVF